MIEWQQRVVDEKNELDARSKKLSEFMMTKEFKSLDEPNKYLLAIQHFIMTNYQVILEQRIELFGEAQ